MATLQDGGTLALGAGYDSARLRLVELPPELESQLLAKPGMRLVIKGPSDRAAAAGASAGATLCTDNATYQMRRAETSNTLLLLPPRRDAQPGKGSENGAPTIPIKGSADHHFELTKVAPRLQQLSDLLFACAIRSEQSALDEAALAGPAAEGSASQSGLSLNDLARQLQASEAEICEALVGLGAFRVGERWAVLDPTLEQEALELVLATLIEEDVDAGRVSLSALVHSLDGAFSEFILDKVMAVYGTRLDTTPGMVAYQLNPRSVSRFRVHSLFQNATCQPFDQFMADWARVLPRGIVPSESYLAGLTIEREAATGGVRTLEYFPAKNLPDVPKDCFQALFLTKPRWKLEELEPFIEHLLRNGKKADLLKKFTRSVRASLTNDARVFVAR